MSGVILSVGSSLRASTQPANVAHPLGPPSVSGTTITVDMMLNQPTRITRMISDLSLQRFIADRIFSNGGGVTGGAVIYDEATLNELYAARDVELIEPGAEFPVITAEEKGPKVAVVEKWGGKVSITDEARQRNDGAKFTRQMRQLTNTIIRKINARAIFELNASIASSNQTFGGNDWGAVVLTGTNPTPNADTAFADLAMANQMAEEDELGITYDLLLLNPQEYYVLLVAYQTAGLKALLDQLGYSVYVSNRVPAGTAYIVASGQVGQMRIEKPLGTETWREPSKEKTWVQSSVRPLMFIDNPFAVLQITDLAGA